MDEPTSGLDARSAKLIMHGVRKIADSGRTIICTIHQPSTEVFNLFDSLLHGLLRRVGPRLDEFDQLLRGCHRFFRMYWRTSTYNLTRLMISVLLGCAFVIIFQGTDYKTYSGANFGVGLVFVSTIFPGIIGYNSVLPVAAEERTALYRERAAETYNALWCFIARTLAEVPSRTCSLQLAVLHHLLPERRLHRIRHLLLLLAGGGHEHAALRIL